MKNPVASRTKSSGAFALDDQIFAFRFSASANLRARCLGFRRQHEAKRRIVANRLTAPKPSPTRSSNNTTTQRQRPTRREFDGLVKLNDCNRCWTSGVRERGAGDASGVGRRHGDGTHGEETGTRTRISSLTPPSQTIQPLTVNILPDNALQLRAVSNSPSWGGCVDRWRRL